VARALDDLHVDLSEESDLESRARSVVERMALVFEASLLVRSAPHAVADAFCASRLADGRAGVFGTLPPGVSARALVTRSAPTGP
jgi:putative acyl-CoA dehydrogenase